jgi:hypothetical protein
MRALGCVRPVARLTICRLGALTSTLLANDTEKFDRGARLLTKMLDAVLDRSGIVKDVMYQTRRRQPAELVARR